jgi:hypothetical protein
MYCIAKGRNSGGEDKVSLMKIGSVTLEMVKMSPTTNDHSNDWVVANEQSFRVMVVARWEHDSKWYSGDSQP